MAKIDTLRLWRFRLASLRVRLSDLSHRPRLLVLLLVGDLVELGLSVALGVANPPAPARVHVSYPTFDVPYSPPPVTPTAALLGIMLGLWMGVMLIAELVVMVRRYQIMRYRAGSRRARPLRHAPPA